MLMDYLAWNTQVVVPPAEGSWQPSCERNIYVAFEVVLECCARHKYGTASLHAARVISPADRN